MATAKLRRGSGEANLFGSCMRFLGRDGIEDGKALNGITNLVKVVGGYALLGFSGVVLEKMDVCGEAGGDVEFGFPRRRCPFMFFITFSQPPPCLIHVSHSICSYYL